MQAICDYRRTRKARAHGDNTYGKLKEKYREGKNVAELVPSTRSYAYK